MVDLSRVRRNEVRYSFWTRLREREREKITDHIYNLPISMSACLHQREQSFLSDESQKGNGQLDYKKVFRSKQ